MTKEDIVSWVKDEFQPLILATQKATIEQQIDNAIRYWNNHSAYKVMQAYQAPVNSGDAGTNTPIILDKSIKQVVNVEPSKMQSWIWQDHPMWSLLGFMVLDKFTYDLIVMSHAFQNYRTYLGVDFRWRYVRSEDPAVGGQLFMDHLPREADSVAVTGLKRIVPDEDIKDQHIIDWVLYYTKALVKMVEGNTLRKSDIVGIKNDGQEIYSEGKEEKTELQTRLRKEGRWATLAARS